MKRTYKSGAQKRKLADEKNEELKKLPKLDQFLLRPVNTDLDKRGDKKSENPAKSTEESTAKSTANSIDHLENNIETELYTDLNRSSDVGLWTELSSEDVCFWVEKGPTMLQHSDSNFQGSKQSYKDHDRFCSKSFFIGERANGEKFIREWLLYSPSEGSVYCFVCKIFKASNYSLATNGLNDWKNAGSLLKSHENSQEHREALMNYLVRRSDHTLSNKLEEGVRKEQKYWRMVLKRVVAVICTLVERNIAFRGTNETFGVDSNGNFIGLLELIAQFDPFLSEHIEKCGQGGSGNTSYLSKTVCNELIKLMAKKVLDAIIEKIKKSKYFGISVDSTPDISHKDQLCVIVRYIDDAVFEPVERFLKFINIDDHTGSSLAGTTVDFLEGDANLDFSDCRSQSYDNANNMSGKYKGMRAKILEKNPLALFLPCAGHSLNLVGSSGADSCIESINYFEIVQKIYVFFSLSTKRWAVLEKCVKNSVKSLSKTRWSASSDSVKVIYNDYGNILDALTSIYEDNNFDSAARAEAHSILLKMEELEFAILTVFWKAALERINAVSKNLQDPKITLDTCCSLLSSLADFIVTLKDRYDEFEEEAKLLLPGVEYAHKRRPIRKRFHDEEPNTSVIDLGPKERLKNVVVNIIETMQTNLRERATAYEEVHALFGFLIDTNICNDNLKSCVDKIVEKYGRDIDASLFDEVKQMHKLVEKKFPQIKITHLFLYKMIKENEMDIAFPNLEITLRIFLCLMITNCSGERSFSKLKLIKTCLRSTMHQDTLNSFGILSSNADVMRALDFEALIDEFAREKCRRKML